MTLRGTVRDGVIAINTHGTLPEGAEVEVVRINQVKSARGGPGARKKTAKKKARSKAEHPLLELAGIWRDRPEWKGLSALEIQQQLRRKAGIGRARG